MKIFIKYFLTLCVVMLFIACEDVNTLCVNESNQTVDSNATDDNSTDSNSTIPEDDSNTTLPNDDKDTEESEDKQNSTTLDLNTTLPTLLVNESDETNETLSYKEHSNIVADIFWVGEESNSSTWDNDWVGSFGGVDEPNNRDLYHPYAFTPNENPFYVALPYNDLDADGKLKSNVMTYIPWASENDIETRSICKNRWLKISANRKDAYGQWEDVGPNGNNDISYVFDTDGPLNNSAAIGLSPAIKDYLGIDENSSVAWVFVEYDDVPDGPWRDIVSSSNSK